MTNILIGSDIHGSFYYAKKFFEKVETYNPEKILLLGDYYYNGARNVPPSEYSPKDVVYLLNQYSSKIIACKGNCESEVDSWVSEFSICDMVYLHYFDKDIVCAHGHHASFDNLPKGKYDIFIQGHTHIGVLKKENDIILANPGSISLPKDNRHSYMVMNENGIKLYDLMTDEVCLSIDF